MDENLNIWNSEKIKCQDLSGGQNAYLIYRQKKLKN
jgi:hypothetical protein